MLLRVLTTLLIITFLSFSQCSPSYPLPYCQANLSPAVNSMTDGMTLKMVLLVTRHGDRTPIDTLPGDLNDVEWVCHLVGESTLPGAPSDQTLLFDLNFFNGRELLPGNCTLGKLTERGHEQLFSLGRNLRQRYVDDVGLLPSTLDPSSIFLRSTDVPRTKKSLESLILGMYGDHMPRDKMHLRMNSVGQPLEDMTPNTRLCPRLAQVQAQLMNTSAFKDILGRYSTLLQHLSSLLNTTDTSTLVKAGDTFNARTCHGMSLPNGIGLDQVKQLGALTEEILQFLDTRTPIMSIGEFVKTIHQDLSTAIASNFSSPKLMYYSGHDSTLGPLLSAILGSFPRGRLVPYASHVEFEIWASASDGTHHISVNYNGSPLAIPKCKRPTLCTSDELLNVMQSIIPTDFHKLCQPQTNHFNPRDAPSNDFQRVIVDL